MILMITVYLDICSLTEKQMSKFLFHPRVARHKPSRWLSLSNYLAILLSVFLFLLPLLLKTLSILSFGPLCQLVPKGQGFHF